MTRSFLFATLFIATIATPGALLAQSPPVVQVQTPPTLMADWVAVTGTSRTDVEPDRVSFTVGVETRAATVEAAVAENNKRTAAVIAAIRAAGAQQSEIRTSTFTIYPQQEYVENRAPRVVGYNVSNNITVTRSKIDDAGRLLQAAINAGVNQASGLNFFVSDPARGREQGLRQAFEDAKAKATVLAAASGRTVGRAITISEGAASMPTPPPMYGRTMAMEAKVAQDVPVESGMQERVFSVQVTFELR